MGKPHLSLPKIPETRTSQCSYAKTPAEPTSDNPTVKVKCSAWGSLIRTRHWASQKFRVPNTKRLMVRQLLIFKPKSQSQLGIPHNEENSYYNSWFPFKNDNFRMILGSPKKSKNSLIVPATDSGSDCLENQLPERRAKKMKGCQGASGLASTEGKQPPSLPVVFSSPGNPTDLSSCNVNQHQKHIYWFWPIPFFTSQKTTIILERGRSPLRKYILLTNHKNWGRPGPLNLPRYLHNTFWF